VAGCWCFGGSVAWCVGLELSWNGMWSVVCGVEVVMKIVWCGLGCEGQ
jgi:hypothetical protein